MSLLLGIDLGTSSVKAVVVEAATLNVVGSGGHEYPLHYPQPGYVEQAPDEWWQALVAAVRTATKEMDQSHVKSIGISGQMHGLVCLGNNGKPLHPAIIWADTRTSKEAQDLTAFRASSNSTLPGNPAAGFAAASVLWLSRHRPDVLDKLQVILMPKDYVRLLLTGIISTDPSDASSTWLYDIARENWAPDIVNFCGLELSHMPPISPSSAQAGTLSHRAAQELGLASGIPVVTGSADLAAQALGHGIVDKGTILVTVGTGGQIITPCERPRKDTTSGVYVFQHNLPNRWYKQAAVLSAGLSLRWLRDLLGMSGQSESYDVLSKLAQGVDAGANGLLFLPYLAGERTPHMDAKASGLFLGLRLHHKAGHLARSIMEGVGFALKECLDLINGESATVHLSGGITQSQVWCQILASIFNSPLYVNTLDRPHACIGAAILAGIGNRCYLDAADAIARIPVQTKIYSPKKVGLYYDRYQQYLRLYALLKDEMHIII